MEECRDCAYWRQLCCNYGKGDPAKDRVGTVIGSCKIKSPTTDKDGVRVWPSTRVCDGCGEWEPDVTEEERLRELRGQRIHRIWELDEQLSALRKKARKTSVEISKLAPFVGKSLRSPRLKILEAIRKHLEADAFNPQQADK